MKLADGKKCHLRNLDHTLPSFFLLHTPPNHRPIVALHVVEISLDCTVSDKIKAWHRFA
jgi:hypothetical protein